MASHSGALMASNAGLSAGLMNSKESAMLFEFQGGRDGRSARAFGCGRGLLHAQVADRRRAFAARLLDVIDLARDHAFFGAILERGFLGNFAFLERLDTGLIEGAPAEGVTGFDDFVDRKSTRLNSSNVSES